ncbi:MAG: hypothetical protein H6743_00760 [Rickettsiaceae bacterium]|nr:hypothetical protein [Rickettsiaceae bacterium]
MVKIFGIQLSILSDMIGKVLLSGRAYYITLNNPLRYCVFLRPSVIRRKIVAIIMLILISSSAYSDYIAGSFTVNEKTHEFTKSIGTGKCRGKITYPVLYNEDQEIIDEINHEIIDFAHSYAICNQGERSNFSVRLDLPPSGSEDYFSIKWITQKDGKIYRIDSLNFDIHNADLIQIDDIFNSMSSGVFKEIIKLSDGHLKSGDNWEKFLDKIGKRDIQYYIKNGEWYLIFNSSPSLERTVEVKVPQYFLEGDDVTTAR